MRQLHNAYFSCPVTIPTDDHIKCLKLMEVTGFDDFQYWERGTNYEPTLYELVIKESAYFIIALPDFHWSMSAYQLTSGCAKELMIAKKYNIPIYLMYKSREGFGIYAAEVTEGTIKGIAGTSRNLKESILLDKSMSTKQPSCDATSIERQRQANKARLLAFNYGLHHDYGLHEPFTANSEYRRIATNPLNYSDFVPFIENKTILLKRKK